MLLQEGVTETFRKSGNPGYLTDQPLLAGSLVTDSSTNKYVKQTVLYAVIQMYVIMGVCCTFQ